MKLNLEITVINVVGDHHLAAAQVGGLTLRGRRADNAPTAVRNLLWKLAGQDHDDDALLAIDLAVAGISSLEDRMLLEDGRPVPNDEPTREELMEEIAELRKRGRSKP